MTEINAKKTKLQKAQNALSLAEKYAAGNQTLRQHIADKMPKWLKANVIANATLFIFGSVIWLHGTHTRSFDPEYDQPGGPKTGPYLEQRTYKQALKDAYWPLVNGEFAPDFNWRLTMSMIIVFAMFSLGGTLISANKSYKKDLKTARLQGDIVREIEKLAKEHNLDADAAKKIIKIAPEIVQNMSADSRVLFDMINDGKVSVEDENFVQLCAAFVAGHLQMHPEDMNKVMSVFEDKTMLNKIKNVHNHQNNGKSK